MTIKEAIDILGGRTEAAKVIDVPRTTMIYWEDHDPPPWRKACVGRLLKAAERKQARSA